MINKKLLEGVIQNHYQYLVKHNFKGWDVFDGLNSRCLQKIPLLYNDRLIRLIWIQFFKRSFFNLRRLTFVPTGFNAKALALFISGHINLYKYYMEEMHIQTAEELYNRLIKQKTSDEYNGIGWGYNFPWQARAFYVPAYKPNMVCSVFVGNAVLDLFEITNNQLHLECANKVALFIVHDLIIKKNTDTICFGYIPGENVIVHNANLLGAAFLSRLFKLTGNDNYKELAEKSVRFSVNAQRSDGAWIYGQNSHHSWVDNFHTGYNLVSIYSYQQYCSDYQFEASLVNGLTYHIEKHFTEEFLPKYSDQNLYPLDIHCFAQAIITFLTLKSYISDYDNKITKIIENVCKLLWDKKNNYFWFQKTRFYTIKIPYIRWAQAWMFYSLSFYLADEYGK